MRRVFLTSDLIVISSYARTPMGGFQGALGSVSATALGATAVKAAVARSGVSPDAIDQIIMGCVLPAGLGQAPARQASRGAGIPDSVEIPAPVRTAMSLAAHRSSADRSRSCTGTCQLGSTSTPRQNATRPPSSFAASLGCG